MIRFSRHLLTHLLTLGFGIVAVAAFAVQAEAATPAQAAEQRFDHRQGRQEERIEHGVASGTLTQPEARRLQRQQAGLQRAENRAGADGRLTRREAVRLEQRQDRSSRHIYRQKHDAQRRP